MKIQVLDQVTIDKIAAGEVIERPASIVKELVENAIDAKATAIVVEIKEGGISFIRITDNGCGMEKEDVPYAFLRHSTSKIRSVDDLSHISSLGFRGEALSSIAAVSQVELITKPKESIFGTVYRIEGGKEISIDETGAPDGTTFLIRQLFYNTPARRKFLKTAMTEASHVGDLLTRLSLSHPEISFQFINNGQSKLHTSGNGNLKDVIYHIYGREITSHLLPVSYNANGIQISGFVGEPIISRGNRNFENYFINGRYVKSNIISKAIEDAYKDFTMQHKYPFTVLHLSVDGETVDVNVHPTKMELRFSNQQQVYNCVCEAVGKALHQEELIPHVELPDPHPPKAAEMPESKVPSSGEKGKKDLDYFMTKMRERVLSYHEQNSAAEVKDRKEIFKPERQADRIKEAVNYRKTIEEKEIPAPARPPVPESVQQQVEQKTEQLNFFDEKLLTKKAVAEYKIIGQVFETYWLVEFRDDLYIIDQHAAHERVLYEKTLAGMKTRDFTSQMISPPIILDLSMKEAQLLNKYIDRFTRIGFEIEEFGQDSYAVRAVPDNLFSIAKKELLMEMIDNLSDELATEITPDIIDEKVASMSCKAAVKGNMKLSAAEVETLIGELLELDNPYHCPHGRPTIIAMSKRELEKKFKRIV
jgi:DNA mismatch repair protein MutL